jgi:acetylornithine deacetylase
VSAAAEELIGRLVSFDTTSERSNLELVDFVVDHLAQGGIDAQVLLDESGRKANLVATVGPADEPGVMLAGHTDVVPAGDGWSCDPFRLTATGDERLVGRGTADMKGFLGIVLGLLPELAGRRLARPLHVALTYDEEVGCAGARELVRHLRDAGPLPRLVVLGEPTGTKVVSAHKGLACYRTTLLGRAAHSSAPHLGTSAVSWGARLVTLLDELGAELRNERNPVFDPPWATINVGRIEGGVASNVVAERCELVWEIRPLPEVEASSILARVEELVEQQLVPAVREQGQELEVHHTALFAVPGLPRDPDPATRAAERLVQEWAETSSSAAAPFVTEAGIYRQAGMPAFVCGPGSLDQAHQRDEHLSRRELAAGVAFVRRVFAWAEDRSEA